MPDEINPAGSPFRQGKKIWTKFGYLILAENPRHSEFKIRAIVRKGAGQAVYRNYVKRIIRHYLRENRSKLQRFNDFTFHYRSEVQIDFKDFKTELDNKLSDLK